jgi:prepilin-type N-terminal cleavage/methylation domain-containing protein
MNLASQSWSKHNSRAFTLVEMLVVIAIGAILSVLALTDFETIMNTAANSEMSDLASTLVRARAYAMANNTYVYVGIQEVDASVSDGPGITPSIGSGHYGRIALCAVASTTGTSGYTNNAPAALNASSLTVAVPLRNFNNLHILPNASMPTSLTAKLPYAGTGATPYYLDLTSLSSGTNPSASLTTFPWPLTGTAQYTFGGTTAPGTVIQFNPQGEAQIVAAANTDSILQWIEIDLEPTHGNNVPASTSPTAGAILIDGPSGAVSLIRS